MLVWQLVWLAVIHRFIKDRLEGGDLDGEIFPFLVRLHKFKYFHGEIDVFQTQFSLVFFEYLLIDLLKLEHQIALFLFCREQFETDVIDLKNDFWP